jgi:hypothetical protein
MSSEADDLIGSTTFSYKGSEIKIDIFKPQLKWANSDEFACRFLISGETLNYKGESIGYDSTQSLILTLSKIGEFINNEEVDQKAIEWPGGKLQFPTFSSLA